MKKLTALVLLLVCNSVWAIPVTWTLNDVKFRNSGWDFPFYAGASGSFTYDADTNTYSDVSITARGDYDDTVYFLGDFVYTENSPVFFPPGPIVAASSSGLTLKTWDVNCWIHGCEGVLTLLFGSPLTNAGGTVGLVLGSSSETRLPVLYNPSARSIISGSLVGVAAVPIPAAIWLLGSALAGLG